MAKILLGFAVSYLEKHPELVAHFINRLCAVVDHYFVQD